MIGIPIPLSSGATGASASIAASPERGCLRPYRHRHQQPVRVDGEHDAHIANVRRRRAALRCRASRERELEICKEARR